MKLAIRQMLAWARKDLYSARWLAAAVATITFIASFAQYPELLAGWKQDAVLSGSSGLVGALMVLSWWAFAERVMHTDPVPSDREPWFTMPVRHPIMVSAKLLTIATFIFLPRAAGDLAVTGWAGADVSAIALRIPMRFIAHFAAFVLPVVALGAVTRNLTQFLVAAIGAGTSLYVFAVLARGFDVLGWSIGEPTGWVAVWLLVFGGSLLAVGFVFWTYGWRRVGWSRALGLSAIGVSLLGAPWLSNDTRWRIHRYWQGSPVLDRQLRVEFVEPTLLGAIRGWEADPYPRRPISERNGYPVPLQLAGITDSLAFEPLGPRYVIRDLSGVVVDEGEEVSYEGPLGVYSELPERNYVLWIRSKKAREHQLPTEFSIEIQFSAEVFQATISEARLRPGLNHLPSIGACVFRDDRQSYCRSQAENFPVVQFTRLGQRKELMVLGSTRESSAGIPLPAWRPFEFQPAFSRKEITDPTQVTLWNYVAPVEYLVRIPNYRASQYTYPTRSDSYRKR